MQNTKNFRNYPVGSAEYVIAHARYQQSRKRNPSMSFMGIKDPRKALDFAKFSLAYKKTNGSFPFWEMELNKENSLDYKCGWRIGYTQFVNGNRYHISVGVNDKIAMNVIVPGRKQFGYSINEGRAGCYSTNTAINEYESDNMEYAFLFDAFRTASLVGIDKCHIELIQKTMSRFDELWD